MFISSDDGEPNIRWLKVSLIIGIIICLVMIVGGNNELIFAYEREVEKIQQKNNEVIEFILMCESSGRHEGVWGDLNSKHPAYGIAQFQKRTFLWMADLMGLENPDWKSEEQQIKVLDWALQNEMGCHWTCYKIYLAKNR
jgi:hypothetical protein